MFNMRLPRERCVKRNLELIVVKVLEDQPQCGYGIIRYVHRTFKVLLSPGTVYPLLNSMNKGGMITSTTNNKRKRLFALTETGREQARRLFEEHMRVHYILYGAEEPHYLLAR